MPIEVTHANFLFHLLMALVTGAAAGGTFFVGYYWRERLQLEGIRRIERWIEWTVKIILETVEVHNDLHPEAKISVGGLSKLLFDQASRPWSVEDKG
jgi:hypothetical protein